MRNQAAPLTLAFILLFAGQPLACQARAGGDQSPKPVSDDQLVAGMGSWIDQAVAEDRFSGVVIVAREFKPLLSRAVGSADPAHGVPNKVDTKFNLGSINKIFTEVAIGQLAQAGKLSPSDTIRKILPDYPSPAADKITVEQLVRHQSGLGDFFGPEFMNAPPSSIRKVADYLPLFSAKPLLFEPGTSQRYSNAGYVVLGLIIEKVSGQSYYDYVRDHIYEPAGMKDTASYAVDEEVPNRAIGLTFHGPEDRLPKRQPNTATLPGRGSSAGGGYSTAGDMLRFAQALMDEKLLNKQWTNWLLQRAPGRPAKGTMSIAGGSPGVNALLTLAPPYQMVVLSNYDPPAAEKANEAFEGLLGRSGQGHDGRRVQAGANEGPGTVLLRGPVTLPMKLDDHLVMIEGKINGQGPYRLAVDTGFAGVMEVTADLARTLKLPITGEDTSVDPSGKNPRTVRTVMIDAVDIGSAHFGEIEAGSGAGSLSSGVDGIVGLKFFNGLVVTMDYPGAAFSFRGGKNFSSDSPDFTPYTAERGIPNIEIDVAGQKFHVDIDSGSPAEVSLPLNAAKSLPLDGELQVVGRGRTASNEFEVRGAGLKGDVRAGTVVLSNPRLDFVDLFPEGNLGYRFLKGLVVTFDPGKKRVRFSRP